MKKIIIFLAVVIGLFAGIAIMNNMQNKDQVKDNPYGKDNLEQSTIEQLDDENYQNIITPDKLEETLQSKEQAFVYFFSPECVHCVAATPKLMKAAKEQGVTIHQYNLLEFEEGWDKYGIDQTPTLVSYENGKQADVKIGEDSEAGFASFLEKHKK